MKQGLFQVTENRKIAKNTYLMVLKGDTSDITASGQFINIKLDGFFLRRPISVCDCDSDTSIKLSVSAQSKWQKWVSAKHLMF